MQFTLHNNPIDYHEDVFMPLKQKWLGDYPVTVSEQNILFNLCRFHLKGTFVMPKNSAEARHFFKLTKNPEVTADEVDGFFFSLIEKSIPKKDYQEFIQAVIKSSFKAGYNVGTEDKLEEIQRLLGLSKKNMDTPW